MEGEKAYLLEEDPIPCCNMMANLGSIPLIHLVGEKPTSQVAL